MLERAREKMAQVRARVSHQHGGTELQRDARYLLGVVDHLLEVLEPFTAPDLSAPGIDACRRGSVVYRRGDDGLTLGDFWDAINAAAAHGCVIEPAHVVHAPKEGAAYYPLHRDLLGLEAPGSPGDAVAADGASVDFFSDAVQEVVRARHLHPVVTPIEGPHAVALMEEVGELAQALLQGSQAQVRAEAVQVACMACRVATEGDGTVQAYRERHGVDGATGGVQPGPDWRWSPMLGGYVRGERGGVPSQFSVRPDEELAGQWMVWVPIGCIERGDERFLEPYQSAGLACAAVDARWPVGTVGGPGGGS